MANLVENDKKFKVICLSEKEAYDLGWGLTGSGDCLCMQCNKPIVGNIYYPVVLGDTMDKECYEKWLSTATNYPEDRKVEERRFNNLKKYLKIC